MNQTEEEEEQDEDVVPLEMVEAAEKLDRADYKVDEMMAESIDDLHTIAEFLEGLRKFKPSHDDKLKALVKLLKSDPGALSELAQLLEKAGVTSTVLTANVVGDENIVGQVSGSGTVSIHRGPTAPAKPPKAS